MSDKKDQHNHEENQISGKLIEKQKEASLVRKIVLICFVVILLSVVGAAAGTYVYITNAIGPVDEEAEEATSVEIPIGSSTSGIGNILESEGLISNATIFRYYVRYKNEGGFQAGEYELSPSMDMDEIIAALKEGRVYQDYEFSFTIPEGRWLETIINHIAENTEHEYDEFMELLSDEDYLRELIDEYAMLDEEILEDDDIRHPLEGYLFPARYDFTEENPEMEEILTTMLDRTQGILANMADEIEASEYTVHEILSMASIIEAESIGDEERETISGVIHNRLEDDMPLQMDPTIAYAQNKHISRTTRDDTQTDHPYNTYVNRGLTPGPINNPGQNSIIAALNPEDHDYLYFYHSEDGQSFFSETYSDHQDVLREHRDNN
ncbi:endolytic transglycosylase MltG [Bacillus sp. H-16]|uniref:endolytic transglycosylase MltG n=1 Tax=Alteribacter salitolerans TaxID=2912333 RepID=UPI001966AACB|nr:endolytic transglycosylase MltG [Alteribacter salitolerans]MBM7097187.1 endolytic transglycosylase MltG [Alteribacter salitolerans]